MTFPNMKLIINTISTYLTKVLFHEKCIYTVIGYSKHTHTHLKILCHALKE